MFESKTTAYVLSTESGQLQLCVFDTKLLAFYNTHSNHMHFDRESRNNTHVDFGAEWQNRPPENDCLNSNDLNPLENPWVLADSTLLLSGMI